MHFEQDFIDFFKELAPNNNKDWFDLNRKRYEQIVKKPFANFVTLVIKELAIKYPEFKDLEAKDCIFRINRDIRFSKDKSPYKLMCSAVIAPEGKKTKAINGVYFELSPEHVRIYGGIYDIAKEDLHAIRLGISANLNEFQRLVKEKNFISTYGKIQGDKNKIVPKELKVATEKEPLLLNKQWYFYKTFPVKEILNPKLNQLIIDTYEVGRPLQLFLTKFIS